MNSLTDPNASLDELMQAVGQSGGGEAVGGILAAIAGLGIVLVLAALLWYVLQVVAYWRIFTKAGQPGWKSIIPVYNLYVQYQLTWKTMFFWLGLALALVGGIAGCFSNVFASIVSIVAGVASLVINIMALHRLSLSFGHGTGFTVGLFFLEPIFMLILGFSQDAYIGNTSESAAV